MPEVRTLSGLRTRARALRRTQFSGRIRSRLGTGADLTTVPTRRISRPPGILVDLGPTLESGRTGRHRSGWSGRRPTRFEATRRRLTGERLTGRRLTRERLTGRRLTRERLTGRRLADTDRPAARLSGPGLLSRAGLPGRGGPGRRLVRRSSSSRALNRCCRHLRTLHSRTACSPTLAGRILTGETAGRTWARRAVTPRVLAERAGRTMGRRPRAGRALPGRVTRPTCRTGRRLTERRLTERRLTERRLTERRLTERRLTER
jgi:hypothetical protein